MGLFNKIKGIFIEDVPEDEDDDEYEDELEKEVKVAKKIESKEDLMPSRKRETVKPVREEKEDNDKRETLDLEIKNDRENIKEPDAEEEIDETKEFDKPPANEFKFPFSDDDFRVEDEIKKEEKIEPPTESQTPNVVLYHQTSTITVNDNSTETEYHEVFEQNGQREEKHVFKRSPIISPVWGILDKNYKKEEIVSRKEIRLTTNNGKADLDAVREKAYGDIASDISASIKEKSDEDMVRKEEPVQEDNLLYDLSEDSQPSVKVVTMGDAEEYYNDLGLEYNVDYTVDKEKEDGKEKDKELVKENLEKEEELEPVKEVVEEDDDEEKEEDNLFDLIDSMYEDKE